MGQKAASLPRVLLDSSALRSAGWKSAAVASLLELARNDQIELIVPQMAYDERRTQWRDDYAKKIKDSIRHIRSARQDSLIDSVISNALSEAIAKLEAVSDAEAASVRLANAYFANGAKVEPIGPADAGVVMANYLIGAAPFSDVKARKDIPDAYIYEAVKRYADIENPATFVTGDENLAVAVRAIGGVAVFTDLSELMEAPVIVGALEQVARSEKWEEYFDQIDDDYLEQIAERFVEENYTNLLDRIHIKDRSIPSDGHDATINTYYDIEDFHITLASHFGNGWIQIECEFECDVSLGFMVYRSDAYDLPDWVSVTYGDPEEDHYFDAEGDRRIAVTMVLAVKMDVDSDGDAFVESIEISESPKIEILDA